MIFRETERLRLRQFELRDSNRLAEYRSDPDVARYQSWEAMTVEEADAFITAVPRRLLEQPGEWCQIAIADRITDELIGDVGLCKAPAGNAVELGVTFAPAAQGRGLASEACRAVVELVFSFPAIEKLTAIVDSRNVAAIALMQRLGMSVERSEIAEFKGSPCTEHHFLLERPR